MTQPSKEFSAVAATVGKEVNVTDGIADTADPAELDKSEAEVGDWGTVIPGGTTLPRPTTDPYLYCLLRKQGEAILEGR